MFKEGFHIFEHSVTHLDYWTGDKRHKDTVSVSVLQWLLSEAALHVSVLTDVSILQGVSFTIISGAFSKNKLCNVKAIDVAKELAKQLK